MLQTYIWVITFTVIYTGCYADLPEGRIINGTKSDKQSWVAEIIVYKDEAWHHNCGGSLISPFWVLSAAHCFVSEEPPNNLKNPLNILRVAVGSTKQLKGLRYHIAETAHLQFGWINGGLVNDIIMLRLKTRVLPLIGRPIALPDAHSSHIGELGYTFGWGVTETGKESVDLLMGRERIVENAYCTSDNVKIPELDLCTLPNETQSATCSGDSGGPLAVKNADRFVLVGVTSYGDSDCKLYSAYARVSEYTDWISGLIRNTIQ